MNHFEEDTCRICLRTQNVLFSIFRKRKGVSPYEKLRKNTKLNIKTNDAGPSRICSECLVELDATVKFLEKCEKSNQILVETWTQWNKERSVCKLDSLDNNITHERLTEESQKFYLDRSNEDLKNVNITELLDDRRCPECSSKRRCKHWTPPKTHTCQQCGKVFSKKYNYQLHIKRHLGELDWPCPTCGLRQLTHWHAERHCAPRLRRPCPIPGCEKTFTTNTNLKTHIRVHSGERPYTCDDCGKSFRSKNTLTDHIRIHTGERPYICPACGVRFRTNKLSAHMCVHAARPARSARAGARLAGARAGARLACAQCGAGGRAARVRAVRRALLAPAVAQQAPPETPRAEGRRPASKQVTDGGAHVTARGAAGGWPFCSVK